jgi:uncharacterized repeat protein (TIGR03803 family)
MKKNSLLKLSIAALSLLAFLGLAAPQASTQVLTTLHSFTSGVDGVNPVLAPLTIDAAGNLFGVIPGGGPNAYGLAFELSPASGGSYTEHILHTFSGLSGDGATPYGSLIVDSAGNLYGTTAGGGAQGTGTVFELVKSSGYSETILYSFGSTAGDGSAPWAGLLMDSQGNLYGTTTGGGAYTNGTVFELANSSGSFVYRILYSFGAVANDGAIPFSSLVMDSTGNIFGTTRNGGLDGVGTVFELDSSSGFAERVLHNFGVGGGPRDGYFPYAALTLDSAGNLYGTTSSGGLYSFGTVFELAPTSGSNSYQILHNFNPASGEGSYPYSTLIIDAAGNLYGTTLNSQGALGPSSGPGMVFELVDSSGVYSYSILANFSGECSTGANSYSGLATDAAGNLYGLTQFGGTSNDGTIFEISNLAGTPAATNSTLTSSSPSVASGTPLTLTATVSSPAGLITGANFTFFNGSTPIGTAQITCGTATFQIEDADSLGLGTLNLTAQFTPAGTGLAVSSASISQTITEAGVALTTGSNTFNGNQTVNGSVAATSFSGNGSGLLNLNPANLGPGTANISITGQAGSALIAAALSGNILESQVTGLATDMASKVPLSAIGAANGVASLDSTGKVPAAQLPAATSSGSPAILVATCTGTASSTKGSTFAFEGMGAIGNETCGNGVSASTAVGIPMTAAGTLSALNVYPGLAGNSGTAVTFTVYKAAAPGWTVSSGTNQTAISAVSFNRTTRRVSLTVASGTNLAAGNTITVSGITGAYNAGTNCTAEVGRLV